MNWLPHLRYLLLGLQLALLPTWGKEVVLGKEGESVELSCKTSKFAFFTWKLQSSQPMLVLKNLNNNIPLKGKLDLEDRVDSKRTQWNTGSFPLIINKLELKDKGTYVCEVEGKIVTEVDLQVFAVGQGSSIQWQRPGSQRTQPGGSTFSVNQLQAEDSGIWTCIFSQDQKTLKFHQNILVKGFKRGPRTVYALEGKQAFFSFPLNFEVEDLNGELRWQSMGTNSPQPWVSFSVKKKKVSLQGKPHGPKITLKESLPLNFTLPQALAPFAGTGNLSLRLPQVVLSREVKLVVMRVTQSQHNMTCEVKGPISDSLVLSLLWRNQTKVSGLKQQRLVEVQDPEAGTWQCELRDQTQLLLTSKVEVSPKGTKISMFMTTMLVGSGLGFLLLIGFCIFCSVRHRRRQTQRMSQIKRLLSERKTCQCPHRLQKTCGLV
ncbi:T-cell surface glycoprotein CD4 [Suncus etruscus]|uniref:T-cell surface glycoprotein CD4 n=1 Tax=Suncus etruscus TaxID=109475 RepID=UPI002110D151|nr:T-cell surface glycoprotein CD4 [Suncus etruscus]